MEDLDVALFFKKAMSWLWKKINHCCTTRFEYKTKTFIHFFLKNFTDISNLNLIYGNGSLLHKWHICTSVTFARVDTFARGHFCTKGHFCTRRHFCTATLLHSGSLLHEWTLLHGDSFARRVTFARRPICTSRHFCTRGNFCTATLLHE